METLSKNIDNSLNNGKVISVRGVWWMYGLKNNLPSIYTSLHSGKDNQIVIEVLTQLDVHSVRVCINSYSGIIERYGRSNRWERT